MIYPNVPDLPGVPQVPRQPGVTYTTPTIGTEATQGALWQSSQAAPTWGIFDLNNNQVVTPDSVIEFANRNEWQVSSFPVQAGAFASYNKVIIPFELSVRMTKGQSLSDRETFINQIASIAGNTTLYTVITPEWTYTPVNITRYEVSRRGASGAYFLAEVDVFFIQIIQVNAQYSTVSQTTNAADPTAQPSVSQGNVFLQSTTPQIQSSADSALPYLMPPQ